MRRIMTILALTTLVGAAMLATGCDTLTGPQLCEISPDHMHMDTVWVADITGPRVGGIVGHEVKAKYARCGS